MSDSKDSKSIKKPTSKENKEEKTPEAGKPSSSSTMLTVVVLAVLAIGAFWVMAGGELANNDEDQDEETAEVSTSQVTIAGHLSSDPDFDILYSALDQVGLTSELDDEDGSYTLFAPTNAAFEQLPDDELESLLEDDEALEELLKNHMPEEQLGRSEIEDLDGDTLAVRSGQELSVEVSGSSLNIGGSTVISSDLNFVNGNFIMVQEVIEL